MTCYSESDVETLYQTIHCFQFVDLQPFTKRYMLAHQVMPDLLFSRDSEPHTKKCLRSELPEVGVCVVATLYNIQYIISHDMLVKKLFFFRKLLF